MRTGRSTRVQVGQLPPSSFCREEGSNGGGGQLSHRRSVPRGLRCLLLPAPRCIHAVSTAGGRGEARRPRGAPPWCGSWPQPRPAARRFGQIAALTATCSC